MSDERGDGGAALLGEDDESLRGLVRRAGADRANREGCDAPANPDQAASHRRPTNTPMRCSRRGKR